MTRNTYERYVVWASKIHLRYILDTCTCITLRPGSQDTAQSSRWAEIPPMTRNTLWYIVTLNCNTLWYTYPIHASRCVLEPRSQWATWYIINTYKYVQIHVLPRTNVCCGFLIRCIFMSEGGGGYSHRGGTPVAPCIDTGLTRSKAASGEGTQTGHVSVCIVQYWRKSIQPHVLIQVWILSKWRHQAQEAIHDDATIRYTAIQDDPMHRIQRKKYS